MKYISAIIYFRNANDIPVEVLINENADIIIKDSCFLINSIHGVHVYPIDVILKIVTDKRED